LNDAKDKIVKWLVVVDSGKLDAELPALLEEASAHAVASSDPIPLSDAETSVEVEGPQDLPARLEGHSAVKGVYPSSDLTLY
jgi:hypothetical protein